MKPHIDSSIADAEANGYYTYIIQCQMTPEKLSDVLEPNWTGGLRQGCQMAMPDFKIVCIWPFGLLDYGSATLRCKI